MVRCSNGFMRITVNLDLRGWFETGLATNAGRTWQSVTSDELKIYTEPPTTIFPPFEDIDALRRHYRDHLKVRRGATISCDLVKITNQLAVRTIFKFPSGKGMAMSFAGTLLTRIGNRHLGLTVQSSEMSVTGVREAVILQELIRRAVPSQVEWLKEKKTLPIDWKFERYDPSTTGEFAYLVSDHEEYDCLFPFHPLTRVRRWIQWLQQSYTTSQGEGHDRARGERPAVKTIGFFSKFKRPHDESLSLMSDLEQTRLEVLGQSNQLPLEELEREVGKEIADDILSSPQTPLALRQQKCQQRIDIAAQQLLVAANQHLSTSQQLEFGHEDLDAKLFNTAEYKVEVQKVVQSLPSLLLETSIEQEKCWLLEIPGSNGQDLHLLNGNLIVFSEQSLAEMFAIRKQLFSRIIAISVQEVFGRLSEFQKKGIRGLTANVCSECAQKSAIVTPTTSFSTREKLLEYFVLHRTLMGTKVRWALDQAIQESDVTKRLAKLCIVVMHVHPCDTDVHLELVKTARLLNQLGMLCESARRIQRYAPSGLRRLVDVVYQHTDGVPNEIISQQRSLMFDTLANTWQCSDEHEKAVKFFSDCLTKNPGEVIAFRLRGGAHWYAGDLQNAIDDFSVALQSLPGDPALLSSRGQALAEAGQFERAFEDLNNALRILESASGPEQDPGGMLKAYTLNGRGAAYAGIGEFRSAQLDYDESLTICPKNAWVYYNQALAYERGGETAAAITSYKISLKMDAPKLNNLKRAYAETRLKALQEQ